MRTSLRERFLRSFERTGDCYLWQLATKPDGYGQIWDADMRQMRQAHRVAWEVCVGPIPKGMQVLHHCDNPPCVRADHLFLGTPATNSADKMAKGRQSRLRGEHNPRAKLTWVSVSEIRAAWAARTATQTALGKRYGVSQFVVSGIIQGKLWRQEDI